MRSVDELSELEACIDDACRVNGPVLASYIPAGCRCPLGAMYPDGFHHPWSKMVASHGHLTREEAFSFIVGFDDICFAGETEREFFAMGARFRARALAGEYEARS